MNNLVTDLQELLLAEPSENTRLTDEMVEKLKLLPPEDVSKIARILVERFPEVDWCSPEAELPKVGEMIGEARVRKVERREDSRGQEYWVVGADVDGKYQTKKIVVCEGGYEVSWKEGPRWRSVCVTAEMLRKEVSRRIIKA